MDNNDNVFDNSGGFSPSFEGQVNPDGAGNMDNQSAPAVDTQGQAQPPQDVQPQNTEPTNPPLNYESEYAKLKQAYDNLRPAYTRATQELSRYKQQDNRSADPAYTPPVTDNLNRDPVRQPQVVDLISGIVQEVVAPMQQQQAELVMQNEVAKFRTAHQDFDTQAPKMYELLNSMPTLWQLGDVGTVLQTAYKLVKAETIEQTIPNIVAQAQDAVYNNISAKGTTSVDRSRPSDISGNPASPADAIKAGILADANKTKGSIF